MKRYPSGLVVLTSLLICGSLYGQVIPFAFMKNMILFNKSWTWISGSSGYNQNGTYGTQGTGSTSNIPGARNGELGWTDGSNLWFFGGWGYGAAGGGSYLNDLWEYTPSNSQWTWISGSTATDSNGTYGTQGVGSTSNTPGARTSFTNWSDSSGNFWLFGGVQNNGYYNDLWEFAPSTKKWTWVSGSSSFNQNGTYGTQGTGSTSNIPGGRWYQMSWIDSSGYFWIFGGIGYPATGTTSGNLNDLWKYDPSTSKWTWVSGAKTLNSSRVCGTKGTPAATNTPGARGSGVTWADSSGNLWLFGGAGYNGSGGNVTMNDMWKFSTSSGQWTWVTGDCNLGNQAANYGNQRVAVSGNYPLNRSYASSWMDSSGNMWLFGGYNGGYRLADTWMYSPSTGYWVWMNGPNETSSGDQTGVYGTKGIPSVANFPGARNDSMAIYLSGTVWLFGGGDNAGKFNDLWRSQ